MADEDFFLSRWSRRKSEARSAIPGEGEPATAGSEQPAAQADSTAPVQAPNEPLPAVDTLTPESDFRPFMSPEVDQGVKREALKALFRDPHFNVMDGLDVYIDDYSKPDPLPAGWLEKLNQMARLGSYEEAPAKAAEEIPVALDQGPPPAPPKALTDQGGAIVPSTASSDTPDEPIAGSEVRQ